MKHCPLGKCKEISGEKNLLDPGILRVDTKYREPVKETDKSPSWGVIFDGSINEGN